MSDVFFIRFYKTVAPAEASAGTTSTAQPGFTPATEPAKFTVPAWAWIGGGIVVLLILLYLVR